MLKRTELTNLSTKDTKTFLNYDGTITIELYKTNITNSDLKKSRSSSNIGTAVADTYIYPGDANVTTYNQDILKIGSDSSHNQYRTLIKFNLPNIPASYTLINATLGLVGYADTNYDDFNSNTIVEVHKVTQDWTESTAKWSNMNDKYNPKIEEFFYSRRSDASSGTEVIAKGSYANITDLVNSWYNGEDNYGLMLKATNETYNSNILAGYYYSKDNTITSTDIKPRLSLTFRNYNGLEKYLSYSSQSHELGSTYINHFNGNLTSTFTVANTISGPLPVTLDLVYNTMDVNLNNDYGYGLGFKPNLLQLINELTIDNETILEYLDEDGTKHLFYEDNGTYKDKEGLSLEILLDNGNYLMKDKDKNQNKFVIHNGTYYLEEIKDTNNKIVTITYDSNNRITKVMDASSNEINVTYTNNKISFISPHKTVEVNLTNNKVTNIVDLGDTLTINYNSNNLIEHIINSNNLKTKYEYSNTLTNKISKVTEYSKNNNEGNYIEFTYNVKSTSISDRKGHVNTYVFNNRGNTESISDIDDSFNLSNAYGKMYKYGEEDTSAVNKIVLDSNLVKGVYNIIDYDNVYSFTCSSPNITLNANWTSDPYIHKEVCKITSTDNSSNIYKEYNVSKGKYYTYSLYIKNTNSLKISLSFDNEVEELEINEVNNDYKRYDLTIFYPATATSQLKFTISPTSVGSIIIDALQLEEGEVANYYNIVKDSQFNNLNNYEISSQRAVGRQWNYNIEDITPAVDNVTMDGSKVLKLINNPLIQTSVAQHYNLSGDAGDVYELSFWYKNEGVKRDGTEYDQAMEPAFIFARPVFFNNNEEPVINDEPEYLTEFNNDWHYFSKKFIAPTNYTSVSFNLMSYRNSNNCYITNLALFKDMDSYSYIYDSEGNLISATDLDKETSEFSYNSNNQLIKITTPKGKHYKYEYDNNVTDRLIKAISPTGINNSITYDSYGNPIRTRIKNTDAFSELENTSYYLRLRGTEGYFHINADKTICIRTSDCSHDMFNIIIIDDTHIKLQYAILADYYIKNNNGVLKVSYGDSNNVFEVIKHTNNSYSLVSNNLAITLNNDWSLSLETYNETNNNQMILLEKTNYKCFIENEATYSPDGRFITETKDSTGKKVTYDFNATNGLINSITDPNNTSTNYTYDSKFRTTNITKDNQSVSYEYINNNLSKITHGTKNYLFNYDEYNNTSSIAINNNTLINNYYDNNNGNLTRVLYGNNNEINYAYDSFDRLKTIIKSNDAYTNYYDNLGRVIKLTSNNETYKYNYDFASRLSGYIYNDYETNYNYDKDNNVITKTEKLNNHNYTYNYSYNDESALTQLSINNTNFNYNYDYLGRLVSNNINNHCNTAYEYITHGNKTSLVVNKVIDNGDTYEYTYDNLYNITEIKKNNNLTNRYYYDSQSQLVREDNLLDNKTINFIYDNCGNILSRKTYTYGTSTLLDEDTYEYNNSNWQDLLTKFNNESITYDNIGNPLTIGDKTLTWMNGRELATYSDGVNNISYKYNLNGVRTSKTVNNITTSYYLEDTSIIFEDRNGTVLYYIYNGDELLGFIYNNSTYYYHKNMFEDIIGIYDSNYNEIVTYEYDTWGVIKNIADNSSINLGAINPFRYRSYYYDEETQLYYLNNRYYNPILRRFINADYYVSTNQDINGHNMFSYCSNNPINKTDFNGYLWGRLLGGLVVGATVGFISGLMNGESGKELLASTLKGGLTGAITAVVAPATFVETALVGVSTALTSQTVDGVVKNEKFDSKEFIFDAVIDTGIGMITNNYSGKKVPGAKPKTIKTDLSGKHAQRSYRNLSVESIAKSAAVAHNTKSSNKGKKKYNNSSSKNPILVGKTCPNKYIAPSPFDNLLNPYLFLNKKEWWLK